MKFLTAYSERKPTHAPNGNRFEPIYLMQYDKEGHKYLIENGKKDVQEVIQANLESTKILNIIRRYDSELLKAKAEQFFDATKMPETLMEAQNMIIRMNDIFAHMPAEEKEKFKNSPEQYIAAMEKQMYEKMTEPAKTEIKEVKNDAE